MTCGRTRFTLSLILFHSIIYLLPHLNGMILNQLEIFSLDVADDFFALTYLVLQM